jgi:hypothetical protein
MLVNSSRFTYRKCDKQFISEISSLGKGFRMERVYPDACDVGFTMVSDKTGKQVVFVEEDEVRDVDNDILYWLFVPTENSIRQNPELVGVTVLLFND